MPPHNIKSMKELMDSFINSDKIKGVSQLVNNHDSGSENTHPTHNIQDAHLANILIDLYEETSLSYFSYGYRYETTLILGLKNASWATRLRLMQEDIIRRYNQEIKCAASEKDSTYNEKTLITKLVIKVSPY